MDVICVYRLCRNTCCKFRDSRPVSYTHLDVYKRQDKILVDEKLKNIYNAINDVCDGELSLNDQATFEYKTSKLKEPLDIVNISTGMKSFIIIKTLLQNGRIDENGIIILDEPEIHLHPEWQLKFAEIIVLLQKEFGLNILLNTHSPYFLNACLLYASKR